METDKILIIRRPDGLKDQLTEYIERISRISEIQSVSYSTSVPGKDAIPRFPFYLDGQTDQNIYILDYIFVTPLFAETYSLDILEGDFLKNKNSDTVYCVINESALKQIDIDNPVGRTLVSSGGSQGNNNPYLIRGVVKDAHFETLQNPVRPMIFLLMPGIYEGYLSLKLDDNASQETIKLIQQEWENITPAYPFSYYWLKQSIVSGYANILYAGRIFAIVSFTALLIACLGYYSLLSYGYYRRKHDVGIRKSLGANASTIIFNELKRLLIMI